MQYIGANFKKGNDLKPLVEFPNDPGKRIRSAPKLTNGAPRDPEKVQIQKEELSKYNKRVEMIEDN